MIFCFVVQVLAPGAMLGAGVPGAGSPCKLTGGRTIAAAGTALATGDTCSMQPAQLLGQVPLAMVEDAHGCPEAELQTHEPDQSLCQQAMGPSCP